MNSEIGFGRKVLQVFEENGISFEHVPSGIDTFTVIVHQSEFMEKEQNVISGIHRAVQPDTLDLESGSGSDRSRRTWHAGKPWYCRTYFCGAVSRAD